MNKNNIFYKTLSLPEILCKDIIELFDNQENNKIKKINIKMKNNLYNIFDDSYLEYSYLEFIIPKKNIHWERIECLLYKELLIHINNYKQELIKNFNNKDDNNLIILLNNKLFTKDFTIQKYNKVSNDCELKIKKYKNTNNRYNLLYYIFFLNTISKGGEIIFKNNNRIDIITPEICNLLLFNDKIDYECNLPKSDNQYIICGQICYNNVLS